MIDGGLLINLGRDLPGWEGLSKVELAERIKALVFR
jgi:hypothetical protein